MDKYYYSFFLFFAKDSLLKISKIKESWKKELSIFILIVPNSYEKIEKHEVFWG